MQVCLPDGSPCDPVDLPLSRSALRSETVENEELRIIWPDGQHRELLVNSAPILDEQGNSHGAVAVFRDLTERNRIERSQGLLAKASALLAGTMDYERALAEDLAHRCGMAVDNARLYRQAQDAIAARDEFLSVASHELRTPMTGLRGFTQLTLKQLAREESPDLERVRQVLNVIDQQSARLSNLISQLLDVSRLEAGRLALDRRAVDMVEVVSHAREAALSVSTQHSLSVRSPASVTVLGDGIRLGQVVSNLLDNAIKYSPYGGEVEVELTQPSGVMARLAVRDHGVGVPPEHRGHIFDRFYQANTLGCFGGLGLGLYISKEIVQLHGGSIDVEYPEDGGTRFVVTLPTGMRATTD